MRTEPRVDDARSAAAAGLVEVFPLHMARSSSVLAAIAVLVVAPFAFVGLLATGGLVVKYGAVGLIPGTVVAGVPAFLLYMAGREIFPRSAHLALKPDLLELRHPMLLRRPLRIPLDRIDRVAVSLPESPGLWDPRAATVERESRGVSWVASDDETVEVLDTATRIMLPLASHVRTDEPNVAFVFRGPVDVTALRRGSPERGAFAVRRLNDVDRARGFLARVRDPAAVARAFGDLGLVGNLSRDHQDLIEPEDEDVERLARVRRSAILGRVVTALFVARFVWLIADRW